MKRKRHSAPRKQATAAAECPGKLSAGIAVAVLLLSVVLLFAQLGHYAFWDDEAGLAIPARGVWHTGDTSIVIGHNINAPRQGVLVRDLKDRVNPPSRPTSWRLLRATREPARSFPVFHSPCAA